jgi:hypothetical protein
MTTVFIRRESSTETHRKEGHVKTHRNIGGMLPQAKKCQEIAKLKEARKDSQSLQRVVIKPKMG